jgi:glycosyltransferase involved in cell wall biosynthesis
MCAGLKRRDKIRVGFVINYDFDSWIGGINYFKTLIDTVMELPERKIEPVILTGHKTYQRVSEAFPKNDMIISGFMDRWSPAWILRNIVKRVLYKDWLLERFLKNHQVDILSHAGLAVSRTGLPLLCWIPDFQHRHLPQFFPKGEIRRRDRRFMRLCRISSGVIVSSRDAQKDLAEFCPPAAQKSFVLNFVPKPDEGFEQIPFKALQDKYHFSFPYFHLPNQFWAHKNHRLVVEALRILKAAGKTVYVVATGNTLDDRQPDFYDTLMEKVKSYGLTDHFKSLGIVPSKEMMAIMRHSVAVINPSFFEGWSTTVEEAKSMGKKVILSDIPVHREQNPERGIYVDPNDPQQLAAALETAVIEFNAEIETQYQEKAKRELPARRAAFGRQFQDIVERYGYARKERL